MGIHTKDLSGVFVFVLYGNGAIVLPDDRPMESVIIEVESALDVLRGEVDARLQARQFIHC